MMDKTIVTPAMVKAGADQVWEFRGFDSNFVAEKVFLAMMEQSRNDHATLVMHAAMRGDFTPMADSDRR